MCNDEYINELETKLNTANYQIKRAVAQLADIRNGSPAKSVAESVEAQLRAYLTLAEAEKI